MAEGAGWVVAALVAAVAVLGHWLRNARQLARNNPSGPRNVTQVTAQLEGIQTRAQSDLDDLWDDHDSTDPEAAIAAAADAARTRR